MDKLNITPAVPTENTENKEVEKNVLTKEQLEELKKNLSPEELKRFEILKSLTSNGDDPKEINKKLSELTNEELYCAAGGVKPSSKITTEEALKKIEKGMIKMGVSSALGGFALATIVRGIYDIMASRNNKTKDK